jgi:hypothetical protein
MMLLQAACEGCKSPFIIALFLVSPPTASRFTTSVFEYRALLARNSPKVKSLKKWGPSADRSWSELDDTFRYVGVDMFWAPQMVHQSKVRKIAVKVLNGLAIVMWDVR